MSECIWKSKDMDVCITKARWRVIYQIDQVFYNYTIIFNIIMIYMHFNNNNNDDDDDDDW